MDEITDVVSAGMTQATTDSRSTHNNNSVPILIAIRLTDFIV